MNNFLTKLVWILYFVVIVDCHIEFMVCCELLRPNFLLTTQTFFAKFGKTAQPKIFNWLILLSDSCLSYSLLNEMFLPMIRFIVTRWPYRCLYYVALGVMSGYTKCPHLMSRISFLKSLVVLNEIQFVVLPYRYTYQ